LWTLCLLVASRSPFCTMDSYYEEAREWETLITRKQITGYGVEIDQAEKEVESLKKLGKSHSDAMQKHWAIYEEFKQFVLENIPSKFITLPIANCDDLSQLEPRKVALTIEQILHGPNEKPLTDNDEITRKDLLHMCAITSQTLDYRIKNMGHPKPSRIEGRKQWFCAKRVDEWREKEKNKT
jgi:predicted DNA-binding transcriptional regulator AlpA